MPTLIVGVFLTLLAFTPLMPFVLLALVIGGIIAMMKNAEGH